MTTPTIAVLNLWKVFGPRPRRIPGTPLADLPPAALRTRTGCTIALRDVSFSVAPGEVFVVMGLSGSGKSTLVRCLTRLIKPTRGEVCIDGEPVSEMSARRLREVRRTQVAMVFQHFGLLPHRPVLDNIAYGLEIQGMGRAARRRRAAEMLTLVGLEGQEHQYPDQLSGGMQQRVGLARALAVDPEVMLFDEPFSALDPLIRRDMQDEVRRLHAEVGKTMVFITHDLAEALSLGDRIAVLRDGELVQVGTPEELVGAPADSYVADFVRDVPRSDVLTVRWIMRDPAPGEMCEDQPVGPDTVIRDAVDRVLRAKHPIPVADGSRRLGVIDADQLLRSLTSHHRQVPIAERRPALENDGVTGEQRNGTPTTGDGQNGMSAGGADHNGKPVGGKEQKGMFVGGAEQDGMSARGAEQKGVSVGGAERDGVSVGGAERDGVSKVDAV